MQIHVLVASVVVLAAVTTVVGESVKEFKDKIGPVAKGCQAEVGATDDDVNNLINRNRLTTKTAKCLQKCVYTKVGVLKKGDELASAEELLKVFQGVYTGNEEKLKKGPAIVDKCHKTVVDSKEKDACEISAIIQQCVSENI